MVLPSGRACGIALGDHQELGSLTKALATLPWQIAVASFVLAVVYVFFTMWSGE